MSNEVKSRLEDTPAMEFQRKFLEKLEEIGGFENLNLDTLEDQYWKEIGKKDPEFEKILRERAVERRKLVYGPPR